MLSLDLSPPGCVSSNLRFVVRNSTHFDRASILAWFKTVHFLSWLVEASVIKLTCVRLNLFDKTYPMLVLWHLRLGDLLYKFFRSRRDTYCPKLDFKMCGISWMREMRCFVMEDNALSAAKKMMIKLRTALSWFNVSLWVVATNIFYATRLFMGYASLDRNWVDNCDWFRLCIIQIFWLAAIKIDQTFGWALTQIKLR